ncbi:MAG: hypothetical protein U0234_14030 [Sandaracinus sp.]
MSEGPTTAQGLTQIAVGGATGLVVFGVPIGLFVRATESEVELGGGTLGLVGFLALFLGGLILVVTMPGFVAPSIPTYRRGALERSAVNLTTGSPRDGGYERSSRAAWTPWVLGGLVVWGVGLGLAFFV